MDLVNADNIEPHEVDIPALEEHSDSYDLSETERVDNHWTRNYKPFSTSPIKYIKLES